MKLAEYLVQRGMNQSELSKALGVSQATISYWLNGVNMPSGKHMFDIYEYTKGRVGLRDWQEEGDD